jgi:hypothetical protein
MVTFRRRIDPTVFCLVKPERGGIDSISCFACVGDVDEERRAESANRSITAIARMLHPHKSFRSADITPVEIDRPICAHGTPTKPCSKLLDRLLLFFFF